MSNAINYTSSINITGNLAIAGTTTSFGDNILVLNNNPKNSCDTGLLLQRYTDDISDSKNYSSMIYSETADEFVFGYSIGDTRGTLVVTDLIPLRARGLNVGDTNTVGSLVTTGGNIGIATTSPSVLLDINGTGKVNNLIVTGDLTTANLRVTGSMTSGDLLVSNAIISGNLTVNGTTTTVNTETTLLEDNLIVINSGPAGLADGGVLVKRYVSGTAGSSNYAGFFYKESSDEFTFALTDSDPGANPVVINDYLPIRAKSLTLETSGTLTATNAVLTTLTTGTLIGTDINVTNITTGTIRSGTLVSSANIAASLITAGTATITNINNTALTSGTIRATTLITCANIAANSVTVGTVRASTLITSANITMNNATAANLLNTNITTTTLRVTTLLTSSNITANIVTTGTLLIPTTTASIGVGSGGSLTVLGGAAVSGSLFVGGNLVGNNYIPVVQSTSFSVAATDKNDLFLISGAATVTLLSASTAGAGFTVSFKKTASVSSQVTIVPTSSTIDGQSNYVLGSQNEIVTLVSNGTNWEVAHARNPVIATVYSVPGTYSFTVPNPVTSVYACVFGAGGGGGSGAGNSGNGGGGGGYCEGVISVSPGDTLTITVGAGGSAGTAGESSSVSDLVATGGGAGGVNSSGSWGSNGTAGTGSGGTLNRSGGAGGQAPSQTSGSGGGGGGAGFSGAGSDGSGTTGGAGSAGFGGASNTTVATNGASLRVLSSFREGGSGGSGNLEGTSTAGNDGGFPGAGGSGSGGSTTAGSGGDGAVVIFY